MMSLMDTRKVKVIGWRPATLLNEHLHTFSQNFFLALQSSNIFTKHLFYRQLLMAASFFIMK